MKISIKNLAFVIAVLFAAFVFLPSTAKAQTCTNTNRSFAGRVHSKYAGIVRYEKDIAVRAVLASNVGEGVTVFTDDNGNFRIDGLAGCTEYIVFIPEIETRNPNYNKTTSNNEPMWYRITTDSVAPQMDPLQLIFQVNNQD